MAASTESQSKSRRKSYSMDAKSVPHTTASGPSTQGALNQHPTLLLQNDDSPTTSMPPFRVGVSEDRNKRWRRAMEDSHAFVYDFAGVYGQGFFGIFDGHAGKHAAEWCGQHFHKYLLDTLTANPQCKVPELLNQTFHSVDRQLSVVMKEKGTACGCTAVIAFLRLEDENGEAIQAGKVENPESTLPAVESQGLLSKPLQPSTANETLSEPPSTPKAKVCRVLYTANVGDARAVLCRGGTAVRLTYDHKGSDVQEVKRITNAGGFVMNNRVNGVLAVTRSLGDSAMKEFVVGSPYTTETVLGDQDTFLIVACDGLWDVTDDQEAVDLIMDQSDPQAASEALLQHALANFSTDNTSVMVVRLGSQPRAA